MARKVGRINKSFLSWTVLLIVGGFFVFSSASLGVLAKSELQFSSIAFNQLFYGLFLGSIACVVVARIDYSFWRKYAVIIFLASIVLTLLVWVPGIGLEHGGAKRWINLGFITFQPSEILKLGFIIYFSAWLSAIKQKVESFRFGLIPFIVISLIAGAILLTQPDTDTFAVMMFASLAMYLVAGGKWQHIGIILLSGILVLVALFFTRPYIKQRIETMLNPQANVQTSSYQLNQSLIAVGSGKVWGRGFGQSVQKFRYLPEPVGDAVFAVASEEFGFVGSVSIIGTFLLFGLSGLKVAAGSKDQFGRLLSTGIVILIVSQAFINIAGMLGILPITGITLPFLSHGGTALFITLVEVGIIMNISRRSII